MPGIFGIIMEKARSRQNLERDLRSMTDSMRHRPSYQHREYITDRLALGRIGPSFLNPEPQPVFNERSDLCIVFEGYVFNVLAALITFEYWNRFFVDGDKPLYSVEMSHP